MTVADDLRVEIYRSFIEEQRAPAPIDIATNLQLDFKQVESALDQLNEQDVIELVSGTHFIWLAHPFSAMDAPFRVFSKGQKWDAICIWDALGVLALMDRSGTVETACPDCGESLNLKVSNGSVAFEDHVVHFEVPARHWYDDIGYT